MIIVDYFIPLAPHICTFGINMPGKLVVTTGAKEINLDSVTSRITLFCLFHQSFLCSLFFLVFSPSSIAITSLREETANLSVFSCVCSICACLGLSVSSSSWCLGRAVVCDSGTPWTFLLPFLM